MTIYHNQIKQMLTCAAVPSKTHVKSHAFNFLKVGILCFSI